MDDATTQAVERLTQWLDDAGTLLHGSAADARAVLDAYRAQRTEVERLREALAPLAKPGKGMWPGHPMEQQTVAVRRVHCAHAWRVLEQADG